MAIVTLEDLRGSIEVILWPEIYASIENILSDDEPILVQGAIDSDGNQPKVIAKKVCLLKEAKDQDNPYEIAPHHDLLIFHALCFAPHFHIIAHYFLGSQGVFKSRLVL